MLIRASYLDRIVVSGKHIYRIVKAVWPKTRSHSAGSTDVYRIRDDGRKPPLHTYRTSPGIGLTCSKDEIVGFARDYLKEETKHYDMAKHIDAVIAKFEEAL